MSLFICFQSVALALKKLINANVNGKLLLLEATCPLCYMVEEWRSPRAWPTAGAVEGVSLAWFRFSVSPHICNHSGAAWGPSELCRSHLSPRGCGRSNSGESSSCLTPWAQTQCCHSVATHCVFHASCRTQIKALLGCHHQKEEMIPLFTSCSVVS